MPRVSKKVEVKDECITCRFRVGPRCRRYPPQMMEDGIARFPNVGADDWCGEYQPKEAAK